MLCYLYAARGSLVRNGTRDFGSRSVINAICWCATRSVPLFCSADTVSPTTSEAALGNVDGAFERMPGTYTSTHNKE